MNKLVRKTKMFAKRNGGTILTVMGAAGVVATTVLAVKATPKALMLLEEAKAEKGEKLSRMETIQIAGPAYIPSAITGMATIACILGANMLNKRQQASLMSAYALLDNSYKEYRNKLEELYGEEADYKIKEEIAKDKYNETDISVEDDKILFFDYFSNRYFESTMEEVIRAEYYLNKYLSQDNYVCLNQWYELLKIPPIDGGDELGWSEGAMFEMYWHSWIDFHHEKAVMDDGLECYILHMTIPPDADFETW